MVGHFVVRRLKFHHCCCRVPPIQRLVGVVYIYYGSMIMNLLGKPPEKVVNLTPVWPLILHISKCRRRTGVQLVEADEMVDSHTDNKHARFLSSRPKTPPENSVPCRHGATDRAYLPNF